MESERIGGIMDQDEIAAFVKQEMGALKVRKVETILARVWDMAQISRSPFVRGETIKSAKEDIMCLMRDP